MDTESTELCIAIDKEKNEIHGPFFELIVTVAEMNDLFLKRLNSVITPSAFVRIDFEDDSSDDLEDYLHQYYKQLEKV